MDYDFDFDWIYKRTCVLVQKMKLNDFVSPSQIPDLRKTINYGRKSIELRKTLSGDYHKVRNIVG